MVKQTEVVCKNEANIFVAQDVLKRVDEYNTGLERNKSTKDARGFWQLEIIVGPYPTRHLARAFLKRWQNSRGILPRRERAIKLVQQEEAGVRLFDKRIIPLHYNKWLRNHKLNDLRVDDSELQNLYTEVRTLRAPSGGKKKVATQRKRRKSMSDIPAITASQTLLDVSAVSNPSPRERESR